MTKKKRNLLDLALRSGVAREIFEKNAIDNIDVKRFETKLKNDYGIEASYASWTVNAWLYILKDMKILPLNVLLKDVSYITFSPTGMVAITKGNVVSVFDLSDLTLIEEIESKGYIGDIIFSTDGWLIAEYDDYTIHIWRLFDGRLTGDISFDSIFFSLLTFSPDRKFIVGHNTLVDNIYVWRVSNGKLVKKIEGDEDYFNLTSSPEGEFVAWYDSNREMYILRISDEELPVNRFNYKSDLTSIAFSPDGRFIAGHHLDQFMVSTIYIWRVSTGKLVSEISCDSFFITGLTFSTDGRLIGVCDSGKNKICIWKVSNGELVKKIDYNGAGLAMPDITFSPDGKFIAGYDSRKVCVWRISDEKLVKKIDCSILISTAFSPDGRFIAVNSSKGAGLWDLRDVS